MASIIRMVEDDLSTVRFNFKSLLTTPTLGFDVISDVHLGDVEMDTELLKQPSVSGSELAWAAAADKEISFRLFGRWTDADAGLDLYADLHSELSRENNLEIREDGATVSRFYRTYPSRLPSHLRGQDGALVQFIRQLQDPHGVPIQLQAKPYSRRTVTAGTPTALTNALLDRHLDITTDGNAPGLAKITATPEAGARFGYMRIGVTSVGNLTERATIYGKECEDGTLYTDTTAPGTVTGASGDDVARVSFATNDTLERRVRLSWVPTDPTAIHGPCMPILRMKSSDASKYDIKAVWGFSSIDPLPHTGPVLEADFTECDVFDWVPWELTEDSISIGDGATAFYLDIYVRRVEGSGTLDLDCVHLHGAEQTLKASVVGLRSGDWAKEIWRGDELIDGPSATDTGNPADAAGGDSRENSGRVNAEGEVRAVPPAGGKTWVAGVHRVKVRSTVFIDDATKATKTKVGELQVIANDAGAGAWQRRKRIGLRSKKNRGKTERVKSFVLALSSGDESGVKFIPRVKQVASTEDGRKVLIDRIVHSYIRAITENENLVIDGTANPPQLYVETSAGAFVAPIHPEGNPSPTVPVGNSLWTFDFGDLPTDPGYDDIDRRGTLPRSVLAREVTVQADVVRRDTT